MSGPAYRLSPRIRVADRLTVLVLATSLSLLFLAGFAAWRVRDSQRHSAELFATSVDRMQTAMELEIQVQEVRHQLDVYLRQSERRNAGPLLAARRDLELWLRESSASPQSQLEKDYVDAVTRGVAHFDQLLAQVQSGSLSATEQEELADTIEAVFETEVVTPARDMVNVDVRLVEGRQLEATTQSQRMARQLWLVGVLAAAAAMIAGFLLARAINRSLFQLSLPFQDVAGQLSEVSGRMMVSTTLDLNDLRPALEQIAGKVREVVEQLHARQREILHADQLATLGRLAAGIAHEIRNPLMAMKLLVQSARSEGADSLDERDLKILDEEIRRLEELLTEFLDFARPGTLRKSYVDVRGLIEQTMAFLHSQADAREVSLIADLPEEPAVLQIDPARIKQVLVNLILNGIQVTSPGGAVRVWLRFHERESGAECEVVVTDDGPGIPEELAEKVFEPFYSTRGSGLGLGLAVTRRIVQSHGGTIGLETGNSGGAQFVIRIPAGSTAEMLSVPSQ